MVTVDDDLSIACSSQAYDLDVDVDVKAQHRIQLHVMVEEPSHYPRVQQTVPVCSSSKTIEAAQAAPSVMLA